MVKYHFLEYKVRNLSDWKPLHAIVHVLQYSIEEETSMVVDPFVDQFSKAIIYSTVKSDRHNGHNFLLVPTPNLKRPSACHFQLRGPLRTVERWSNIAEIAANASCQFWKTFWPWSFMLCKRNRSTYIEFRTL